MRITGNMVIERVLRNIVQSAERLTRYQEQLTSGKQIRVPSDEPSAVLNSMRLRSGMVEADRYLKNLEDGVSWLSTADTALANSMEVLQRARELIVRGSNDTLPQPSKNALAVEMDHLREQLLQIANSTYDGRYVFAGQRTLTQPFEEVSGTVQYRGDDGRISREIGLGVTMVINVLGSQAFPGAFEVLGKAASDLRNGDSTGLSLGRLREMDQVMDAILDQRSELGAKINRLENTRFKLEELKVNLGKLLSDAEDADLGQTVVQLKVEENAYRMALSAAARVIQPTLLDFLK